MNYNLKKVAKLFSNHLDPSSLEEELIKAMHEELIPPFPKTKNGTRKSWPENLLPDIGQRFGFLKRPTLPSVICSFVTKGGVLKTSLTLNLARLAALHNIKTCVVGLDMQGDITSALGFNKEIENEESFDQALKKLSTIRGLPDLFSKKYELKDLLIDTDLPTLSFIPETPELVSLDRSLNLINKREFWLEQNVIKPLKKEFDLIILDASPNWNLLITNALASCDLLVSPLECKINNFRNFQMFDSFIREFKSDMNLHFEHFYVPTRWQKQRKLSLEIRDWYREKIPNCSEHSIPEHSTGEESSALNLSVAEFSPGCDLAVQYANIAIEAFNKIKLKKYKEQFSTRVGTLTAEVTHGLES